MPVTAASVVVVAFMEVGLVGSTAVGLVGSTVGDSAEVGLVGSTVGAFMVGSTVAGLAQAPRLVLG
jgi:hypothetical protein